MSDCVDAFMLPSSSSRGSSRTEGSRPRRSERAPQRGIRRAVLKDVLEALGLDFGAGRFASVRRRVPPTRLLRCARSVKHRPCPILVSHADSLAARDRPHGMPVGHARVSSILGEGRRRSCSARRASFLCPIRDHRYSARSHLTETTLPFFSVEQLAMTKSR